MDDLKRFQPIMFMFEVSWYIFQVITGNSIILAPRSRLS